MKKVLIGIFVILITGSILSAEENKTPINYYKDYISPILPFSCRYTPTCSGYMDDAINKYGFFGILMGVNRFQSCNLLSEGGRDLVQGHIIQAIPEEKNMFVDMIIPVTLSVAIPGLGQVYHGQYYDGLFAFLSAVGLGALTYESFSKEAWGSGIVMGTLFLIFYSANIYGTIEIGSHK